MFDTDTEDGEFVEKDVETAVSAMAEDNLLHNMRISSMKLKDLWPHAIEWMVKKSLDLHVKEDERFRRAFERLDKKPSGLMRSKHNSSSWKSSFTTALARPEMVSAETTSESEPCDACSQTCHSALFEVRFCGKLYCRETLDELDGDDNINGHSQGYFSSFGSDASGASVSQTGLIRDRRLLSENYVWYLGSTCVRKAQASHKLQHWRYHIYNLVTRWLTKHGYNARGECSKRDEMSMADRDGYAVDVVDHMVKDGFSKKTWQVFKDTVDGACASRY